MSETRRSVIDILAEVNQAFDEVLYPEPEKEEPIEDVHYPLVNAIENEILMHRDAHFGGKFSIMIEEYEKGEVEKYFDFSLREIKNLATQEEELGENLAALRLSGSEAELVASSREMYRKLREVYELSEEKDSVPSLIAELILSEKEEGISECNALIKKGREALSSLLDVLQNEDLNDPLFPGFGLAPQRAAYCLGELGCEEAIIPLFEATVLDEGPFDEIIFQALAKIGEPAKLKLLQILKGEPVTLDNERAAVALINAFMGDAVVARESSKLFRQFSGPRAFLQLLLPLIWGLPLEERAEFITWAKESLLTEEIKEDVGYLLKDWEESSAE